MQGPGAGGGGRVLLARSREEEAARDAAQPGAGGEPAPDPARLVCDEKCRTQVALQAPCAPACSVQLPFRSHLVSPADAFIFHFEGFANKSRLIAGRCCLTVMVCTCRSRSLCSRLKHQRMACMSHTGQLVHQNMPAGPPSFWDRYENQKRA